MTSLIDLVNLNIEKFPFELGIRLKWAALQTCIFIQFNTWLWDLQLEVF
jgi:hypothetical protein